MQKYVCTVCGYVYDPEEGCELSLIHILDIQGMHCKNCATRIENAYNRKEGFWAQVDFKQNRALVRTKRPVSENELRQIVWQAGYSAGSVQLVRR